MALRGMKQGCAVIFFLSNSSLDESSVASNLVSQGVVFVSASYRSMAILTAWHTPTGVTGGVNGNLNLHGECVLRLN